MRAVLFSAGRPSNCWLGSVEYEWDAQKKAFHVQTEAAVGTGSFCSYSKEKLEIKTCRELDKILHNMKLLEAHYKKVYGK